MKSYLWIKQYIQAKLVTVHVFNSLINAKMFFLCALLHFCLHFDINKRTFNWKCEMLQPIKLQKFKPTLKVNI